MPKKGSFEVKVGLAEMLKGGVIMDVMNAKQAKQAEQAGAVAVMALEKNTCPNQKRRWNCKGKRSSND